jgi:hypothetical protein
VNCPNCQQPMVCLRERYQQAHHDEACPHHPHGLVLGSGAPAYPDECVTTLAEYTCAPCQVGVHPPVD